ncbi:MAG: AraC family transcriptional regulator [Bacilli bacterium]|nr:AraC family transcriptional regulator [Bacilli bacterium]
MAIEKYDFNYNVSLKTMNCISGIDFTYHVSNHDYPVAHIHTDYFEFTIVTKGVINNISNGTNKTIEEGTLFITSSNVEHHFIQKSEELWFINIICRNKVLDEINDFFGRDVEELLKSQKVFKLPKDLIYQIEANINFANSLKEEEWEKCNSVLKSSIITIINQIYLDYLKTNYTGEKWEIQLNTLTQNAEFYTYNVNQLGEILGYSRTQLYRLFMNKYQMTPYDYLKDLKMKYAVTLLSHTDYSISEIAKMVGYSDLNQFTKNFKEKYNKQPIDFRKKNED